MATIERVENQIARVEGWKQRRFRTIYPGLDADVLMGNGTPASGNTFLETVRSSYRR